MYSKSNDISVKFDKFGNATIEQRNRNGTTVITIQNIAAFSGNNKGLKKMFNFLLQKINEQAVFEHKMVKNFIQFSINELVDLGIFSSYDYARKSCEKYITMLRKIDIRYKNNKGDIFADTLFGKMSMKPRTGYCRVDLGESVDWDAMFRYIALMPSFIYGLSNRGFTLGYNIVYLARANPDFIYSEPDDRYLKISFRKLQAALRLPLEEDAKNTARDIKKAIEHTVEEFSMCSGGGYVVEMVCKDNAAISEWLDTGYIRVYIYDQDQIDYLKSICTLRDQKQKLPVKGKKAVCRTEE